MDVEIEQPHRHHSTGHPWLDKILPVSALFVSLVSILIAYHHGEVMRELVTQNERLVQASSRPHLILARETAVEKGLGRLALKIVNGGVGPADIRRVEVRVDGKPVASAEELLSKCCQWNGRSFNSSDLLDVLIRPGENYKYVEITSLPGEDFSRALKTTFPPHLVTDVCYCSLLDECWTVSTAPGRRRPHPVEQCTPSPTPYS